MARKVTEPSFEFWYDEKYYTVQGAKTILEVGTKDDIATMRAEYTRMRDVAQKRIKRLQKTFPESKASQHRYDTGKRDSKGQPIYAPGFQKLKNIDPRDLPKAFSELAKFVRAKTSTVTGQRRAQEKTIKTINQSIGAEPDEETGEVSGATPLNKQNYWRFIKIMTEARKLKIVYDSEKMVELADALMELDDEQFERTLNHLEEMIVHSREVKGKLREYKVIHRGQDVDIDEFLDSTGW